MLGSDMTISKSREFSVIEWMRGANAAASHASAWKSASCGVTKHGNSDSHPMAYRIFDTYSHYCTLVNLKTNSSRRCKP
jgi:hypothetical protein